MSKKYKDPKYLKICIPEKVARLNAVTAIASDILGKSEAKKWLHQKIPSLGNGNDIPLNLLDTEAGHRLVTQVLMRIKYCVYD